MASIRGFVIALVVSLVTMIGSGIAGNLVYGSETPIRWTAGRSSLAALFVVGLLVFLYTLVPVVLRAFLVAQVKIGNGEVGAIQWAIANERAISGRSVDDLVAWAPDRSTGGGFGLEREVNGEWRVSRTEC